MVQPIREDDILTAHQRCEALLHNGGKEDPELIYLGAELARYTGQKTRENELLGLFLKKQTEKSEKLQKTLLRLMEIGNKAEVFDRYFKEYGCEPRHYQLALDMLKRMFENGDAAGYAALSETLLQIDIDDVALMDVSIHQLARHRDGVAER